MSSVAQRAVSETLGTAFLLATVIGSGIMAQRLSGGNDALALLCNTLPTGAILTVLILILGPVSGAHFNPAVSLAFGVVCQSCCYVGALTFGYFRGHCTRGRGGLCWSTNGRNAGGRTARSLALAG